MSPDVIRAGGISVNLEQCTARAGRRVLRLTLTEYNLLVCLLRNPGRVLSRRQLLDAAWGENYQGGERTVDTHIGRLRKKLGKAGQRIQTLRGMGYKLDAVRRRSV
ncbi:MAG: response regulator transcription factor [Acidobacteriota bacterium]|nr:response regulator transcription factor [Acidobacteriota bacterium]